MRNARKVKSQTLANWTPLSIEDQKKLKGGNGTSSASDDQDNPIIATDVIND